jgi:hypothetical protein
MSDKYDHKFVFAWKNGVLDFSYEEDGDAKFNKHFDFDKKKDEKISEDRILGITDESKRDLLPSLVPTMPIAEPTEAVQPVSEVLATQVAMPEVSDAKEATIFEEPVKEPVYTEVIVNADKPVEPTIKVVLPEVMPQIVEITAAPLVTSVDPASPEPQIVLSVTDASIKVPENAELMVVKTSEGNADLVVAVPPEVAEMVDEHKVDLVKVLGDTVRETDSTPDLPDLTPENNEDVIPQVVGMTVIGDTVHLTDISENIPADVKLLPVETPPEMPNIIVAIDEKTSAEFEDKGLDPAEELSTYLAASETEIATTKPLDEDEVADAFGFDEGVHEYPEGRRRWWRRFTDRD